MNTFIINTCIVCPICLLPQKLRFCRQTNMAHSTQIYNYSMAQHSLLSIFSIRYLRYFPQPIQSLEYKISRMKFIFPYYRGDINCFVFSFSVMLSHDLFVHFPWRRSDQDDIIAFNVMVVGCKIDSE